ncbi:restriction endonuclease [Leifsonia sp. NPDC080035]|uniref:Restriction endonuclease n=1 Tax=Leifsonia sp. NPDC080035 TaxID=3143936 RepID=A0AAU7GEU6_9MICO
MHVVLKEWDAPEEFDLPRSVAVALHARQIATVVPSGTDGRWTVSQVRKVGSLTIDGHQVDIRPKLAISRLFFLLGYAHRRQIWQPEHTALDSADGLVPAVADAFLRQLSAAVGQGLLRGYRERYDTDTVVRGRIEFVDQFTRRPGLASPLELRFDEFTVDIDENRILAAAIHRLLRLPLLAPDARRSLLHFRGMFADVGALPRGLPAPVTLADRRTEHYQPALALARLILADTSIEHRPGGHTASAFLVDVAQVFEDFVSEALRESLERFGGRVISQRSDRLDVDGHAVVRPDIVWERGDRIAAVADAKYKSERPAGYPNVDVYQMVTYCTRYGLRDGHLVYAAGQEKPRTLDIIGAPVAIHCHALELSAAPRAVLAGVDRVAELIHETGRTAAG